MRTFVARAPELVDVRRTERSFRLKSCATKASAVVFAVGRDAIGFLDFRLLLGTLDALGLRRFPRALRGSLDVFSLFASELGSHAAAQRNVCATLLRRDRASAMLTALRTCF